MPARGLNNRNPGNIKWSARNKWQGLDDPPSDDKGFCRFKTMPYGVRAICMLLIAYQDRYNCDNVSDLIARWAPAGADGNPTDRYAAFVADKVGVAVRDPVDTHDYATMRKMVEAIIRFENGSQPLTDAQIGQGLTLAGLKEDVKPLSQSKTVAASTAAAVSTVAGGAAQQLKDAADQLSPLATYSHYIAMACAGLTILAVGVVVWERFQKNRQGIA